MKGLFLNLEVIIIINIYLSCTIKVIIIALASRTKLYNFSQRLFKMQAIYV